MRYSDYEQREMDAESGLQMDRHAARTAVAAARKTAVAAGYYIREGSYSGTADDRLGRWYIGHNDDEFFRPYGAGYRTQGDAWLAAAEALSHAGE